MLHKPISPPLLMAISDHSKDFGKPVNFQAQALFHHSGWWRALLLYPPVCLSSAGTGKELSQLSLGFCHVPDYSQAGGMSFSWLNEGMERKLCLQYFHQDGRKSCLLSFLPSAVEQHRTDKNRIEDYFSWKCPAIVISCSFSPTA